MSIFTVQKMASHFFSTLAERYHALAGVGYGHMAGKSAAIRRFGVSMASKRPVDQPPAAHLA